MFHTTSIISPQIPWVSSLFLFNSLLRIPTERFFQTAKYINNTGELQYDPNL